MESPTGDSPPPAPALSVPLPAGRGNTHGNSRRPMVWWGVLAVAACGVVATAHGLFAVAVVSGVGAPVACLYVPITDGLALVAYASTGRLTGWDRGYAWLIVVVAAGLSGLAQAVNLAGLGEVDWRLRFGVGYWPAVAVAVAAHLLWLVGRPGPVRALVAEPVASPSSELGEPATEPGGEPAPSPAREPERAHPVSPSEPTSEPPCEPSASPPGEPHRAPLASPAEPASEPPGEPAAMGSVSPIRRQRARGKRAPDPALLDCDCGLARCPGRVSKAARTRHRAEVKEAAELAGRAQSNGHREPAGAR